MSDRQNMFALSVRGDIRIVLGMILQDRNEVGWQEAIRSGVIDAEFAAGKNKQDDFSLKYAGIAQSCSHKISRSKTEKRRHVTNCGEPSRTI
jgi:hypothetical protein